MTSRKTIRWLWQALVLSVVLNAVFLLLFYTTVFRKDIYKLQLFSGPLVAKSSRLPVISDDFLDHISSASLEEIFLLLKEERLFYGYPVRGWALGVAIHHYGVDISPVLSHPLTFIKLGNEHATYFLPDLCREEYDAVCAYLSLQRYPFTTQGLFRRIARDLEKGFVDEDCIYHFCHTKEFLYLRTVLYGADEKVSTVASLARMVIRHGEELFFAFCNEQTCQTLISDGQRRSLLSAYVQRKEPLAALLLVVHDVDWVLHECADSVLKVLLDILPKESSYSQEFISRVATSPRQDILRHAS